MPKIDKAVPNTVVWADLSTPDIAKARAFYSELLGWSFTGGDDENMGYYTTANRDGRRVAAMAKQQSPSEPPVWTVYIGTESADETKKKVEAAGGKTLAPPMDIMDLGRMAIFQDPTGATFGVWQSKSHTGLQLHGDPGAMAWHEVYTRDAKKALDFYTRVFGLKAEKMEGGMEYWTLHAGDHLVGGLMQLGAHAPKDEPSHWNTYFSVSDTDAATKKLEQLGGKVRQPAFDTPYGRMSAVTDPFGATFCIIKPADEARR
jgi:predicted enzyme related to lactoylglutathione lyase